MVVGLIVPARGVSPVCFSEMACFRPRWLTMTCHALSRTSLTHDYHAMLKMHTGASRSVFDC